jgi:hypothetical protein
MNSTINLSQRTQAIVTELKATPVVKNKFWIVEKDGQKVASIMAAEDGVVFIKDDQREKYPSITMLKNRHNIEFLRNGKKILPTGNEVNGFPASGKPHNPLYDVCKKLPIYTKESKSKSFYCAGHYLVRLNNHWSKVYCPKLITLQRYEFIGPFKDPEEQAQALRQKNGL